MLPATHPSRNRTAPYFRLWNFLRCSIQSFYDSTPLLYEYCTYSTFCKSHDALFIYLFLTSRKIYQHSLNRYCYFYYLCSQNHCIYRYISHSTVRVFVNLPLRLLHFLKYDIASKWVEAFCANTLNFTSCKVASTHRSVVRNSCHENKQTSRWNAE